MIENSTASVAAALDELTSLGPRFHGSPGNERAAQWLSGQVSELGFEARRQQVRVPGWEPASERWVEIVAPTPRVLTAWEMLFSGGSNDVVEGRLEYVGPGGIWGDSIVWQRYAVRDAQGIRGYVHARDTDPAAPQPLPTGSDQDVPHLVVSHADGQYLSQLLDAGHEVIVRLRCDAGPGPERLGDNLIVEVPSRDGLRQGGPVVCAHYDTFFNTVGAYDNGSGTIAVLAALSEWRRRLPACPVRVVFFTAEEWHLSGSRAYVATLDDRQRAALPYALNVDGLGRSDHLELFSYPEAFEREVRQSIMEYVVASGRSVRVTSRFPTTKGTDDASFKEVGIPATFFTFNDLARLHQPDDLPNEYIARNIVWAVPLVVRLVDAFAGSLVPRPAASWL